MATVKRMLNPVLAPRVESTSGEARSAPPRLLRCLVVSSVAARRRLIRSAAEQQTWDAIVCRDAGEFLRAAFKRSVPLMVVDLPAEDSPDYAALREATAHAKQITSALLVVAGAKEGEELWARQLGAWSYLSESHSQRGFEFLFSEARAAISKTEIEASPPLACVTDDELW
jgi:DNA-binding response OmpR family regulator